MHRLQCLSALVAGSTLLAACGGGGGSAAAPPPPAASLTLQGTAATGAAIAAAAVTAKCNGGTGTATTAANGTYTIALTAGTLPCSIKVAASGGDLHSVVAGSGATATANITPITQLIVASLAGKDPATYFSAFAAADITALTSSAVDGAQAKIVGVLKNNGVDASTLGNLITGSLVAANGGTAGNALDQVLDTLNAKLTSSGVTLAQFVGTVLQTVVTATPSGTPSVAVDLALQASAASCSALRSGKYRVVVPEVGAVGSFGAASAHLVNVDVTAGTVADVGGSPETLIPTAGSPCRFSTSGGGDIVVSQSGAFGVRTGDGFFGFGFPEQSIAIADLAGDWNFLGYDHSNRTDPLAPRSITASINSTGVATFTSLCIDAKTCTTTGLPSPTLTVNAAGGYDIVFSTTEKSRLFAFRAGGGELMLAGVGEDGTWTFGTRRRTNAMPAVDGVPNLFWNVNAVNLLNGTVYGPTGQAISNGSNTTTSIDTAGDFYTRNNVTNFTTTPVTTRPETIYNNAVAGTARQGYRWRKPETGVINSAGSTVNVPEFIAFPLRGIGMTVSGSPSANVASSSFGLSVIKP
jgi:hypothetical protein